MVYRAISQTSDARYTSVSIPDLPLPRIRSCQSSPRVLNLIRFGFPVVYCFGQGLRLGYARTILHPRLLYLMRTSPLYETLSTQRLGKYTPFLLLPWTVWKTEVCKCRRRSAPRMETVHALIHVPTHTELKVILCIMLMRAVVGITANHAGRMDCSTFGALTCQRQEGCMS
jgi:hypothetical protein